MPSLEELPRHQAAVVERVGGQRSFRRRLLEMGLIPGTEVQVVNVAPFGDPLEIEVRQSRLSIRRHEARLVEVRK
jgi:Fe2+ transport system protein FeoA